MESDDITPNSLYRYDRYIKLQRKIAKELQQLGRYEAAAMEGNYTIMAQAVNELIARQIPTEMNKAFLILDTERVKAIVNGVWCADGKTWSSRVWDDKTALAQSIEKGLMDSVARGVPKDEMVKTLRYGFGTSFSNADRIARTELAHIQNTSTRDTYKKAGIQYVETIVADDERLCDICAQYDGKITPINEAREGTAFCFHPNCRCDIVPVIG